LSLLPARFIPTSPARAWKALASNSWHGVTDGDGTLQRASPGRGTRSRTAPPRRPPRRALRPHGGAPAPCLLAMRQNKHVSAACHKNARRLLWHAAAARGAPAQHGALWYSRSWPPPPGAQAPGAMPSEWHISVRRQASGVNCGFLRRIACQWWSHAQVSSCHACVSVVCGQIRPQVGGPTTLTVPMHRGLSRDGRGQHCGHVRAIACGLANAAPVRELAPGAA
jgi:hypothetical protein